MFRTSGGGSRGRNRKDQRCSPTRQRERHKEHRKMASKDASHPTEDAGPRAQGNLSKSVGSSLNWLCPILSSSSSFTVYSTGCAAHIKVHYFLTWKFFIFFLLGRFPVMQCSTPRGKWTGSGVIRDQFLTPCVISRANGHSCTDRQQ